MYILHISVSLQSDFYVQIVYMYSLQECIAHFITSAYLSATKMFVDVNVSSPYFAQRNLIYRFISQLKKSSDSIIAALGNTTLSAVSVNFEIC